VDALIIGSIDEPAAALRPPGASQAKSTARKAKK
jgi:hypothetical protein